jgi:DNA (cytosine-5)-methyltransferase 1
LKKYKVIDLFAGPGGLAEGFSSVLNNDERVFSIKLSVEKEESAHRTLLLRSFCRQFKVGQLPPEYYRAISEKNLSQRENKISELFELYPRQYKEAKNEAIKFELGKDSEISLDNKIEQALNGEKKWVLIGGPPCQAYSMAGRSRVGGISNKDHRVYLYKEYLRVIAKHSPAVFVMENVKGLLSAKVDGRSVFKMMLSDLSAPYKIFQSQNNIRYRIYSLVKKTVRNQKDYLIQSEDYGIPQKRHRVILLGVREDLSQEPSILQKKKNYVNIEDVIGNLPPIRSGLNREFDGYQKKGNGEFKRVYKKIEDNDTNWETLINKNLSELIQLEGFNGFNKLNFQHRSHGIGSEFIKVGLDKRKTSNLSEWYTDRKLGGVLNHQSRSHLTQDLKRYLFATLFTEKYETIPKISDFKKYGAKLMPDHVSADSGSFNDRFRVQKKGSPATTITSHISKDGHYFIHYDKNQVRSLTVREAARIQTFPDNYLFRGSRTKQYHQVGNAVPPYLAFQIGKIVQDLLDV